MTLCARPTRLEFEVSFKVHQIIKRYLLLDHLPGNGNGFCLTKETRLYWYLMGALEALQQLSGRGIEQKEDLTKDLIKITDMVSENNKVIFEER